MTTTIYIIIAQTLIYLTFSAVALDLLWPLSFPSVDIINRGLIITSYISLSGLSVLMIFGRN